MFSQHSAQLYYYYDVDDVNSLSFHFSMRDLNSMGGVNTNLYLHIINSSFSEQYVKIINTGCTIFFSSYFLIFFNRFIIKA